jgi:hypothetical protein
VPLVENFRAQIGPRNYEEAAGATVGIWRFDHHLGLIGEHQFPTGMKTSSGFGCFVNKATRSQTVGALLKKKLILTRGICHFDPELLPSARQDCLWRAHSYDEAR